MKKFIPYEKLSKKEKRRFDQAKRQTWGSLNPITRKPPNSRAYDRVKTTGEAGGLSKPYKGMIQPRLKAHEKFANRKCLLAAPLPGGGYFICL